MTDRVWTIVLAAGSGRRLATVTAGVPKQFWRPSIGAPSLLDDTIARLSPLTVPERTLTIVGDNHRHYVRTVAAPSALGRVIYQPLDRGTAVGVLLPLVSIAHEDPGAIVIMTPSDHGVEDTRRFRDGLLKAVARVRARQSGIVLLGVAPTSAAEDYGWITASSVQPTTVFRSVTTFVEKPDPARAVGLYRSGAVWNTMVLVARAGELLSAFRRRLPLHTQVLTAAPRLDQRARDQFLNEWYRQLPPADFSRDVLTPTRPLSLLIWPVSLGWSDLGTPHRLEQWLMRPPTAAGAPDDRWSAVAAQGAA